MDIVGALSDQLALNENAARGLAGQVLGLVEEQVRDQVSFGAAAKLRDAVPEMSSWQLSAPTIAPGSLSLETITPTPGRSELELLLERFHVEIDQQSTVRGLMLQFLSSRLDQSVLRVVAPAMP